MKNPIDELFKGSYLWKTISDDLKHKSEVIDPFLNFVVDVDSF